nr:MAG TPA: tail-collar fiber protein [Caudoviricetes sp.]
MAQFPGLSLTLQGNKMILKSATGRADDRLIITKAVIGDGQLTKSIDSLTSLVNPKLEIGLSNVKEVTNGQMQLQFNFDNKKVETGFYWREVGVYGKNGDSGQEKLIGYSNASGLTSYIPDKTNAIPMQRLLIALGVGDNPNVKGLIDLSTAVTREQLDESIKAHNSATNAHQDAFNKKLDITSNQYAKAITKHNQGLQVTKGDNSQEVINFITSNYNDSDINKVLNLATLKSLLGQGAIVASKLDTNAGFVKFANGFTIQWGLTWFDSNKYYKDISLPISSTVLIALATDDSVSVATSGSECFITWNSGFSQANRTTIRFLTNRTDTGSFVWMTIGKA